MKPYLAKVLYLLMVRKSKGVTFEDFPAGFRLEARIHDLRHAGYEIARFKMPLGSTHRAGYVLKRRPGMVEVKLERTRDRS